MALAIHAPGSSSSKRTTTFASALGRGGAPGRGGANSAQRDLWSAPSSGSMLLGGSTSPATSNAHPTTLPSLSAPDLADLNARRGNASSMFQEALARGEAGRQQTSAQHVFDVNRLQRAIQSKTRQGMQGLGGRGLGYSPRFAGRFLADTAGEHTEGLEGLGLDKASRLSAIEAAVNQARRERDSEFANVDAETVRRRADLSRIFTQIGA